MSAAVFAIIPLVAIVVIAGCITWHETEDLGRVDQVGFTLSIPFIVSLALFFISYLGNVVATDSWAVWAGS